MKNFSIIDSRTGREYWISRSVSVVILATVSDEYVLAVQRGSGTPDPEYVGAWSLPCGYVDFDETTRETAARELFEETGLDILPERFEPIGIMDDPNKDKRQNICIRYKLDLSDYSVEELTEKLTSDNSEENEVSDIRFIPIWQVPAYKWAFNHDKLIKNYVQHT